MIVINIVLVPIHPAGWPFIGLFAAVAFALFFVAAPLGWIGIVLTAWCTYFFRNPARVTPEGDGFVIAPADGVVLPLGMAPPPPELEMGDEPLQRICIFMNVFNVHVNRIPLKGTIERLAYIPGRFFNASLDKASKYNERMAVRLKTSAGDIAVVQIAGLVARRIKCDLVEGQEVQAGEVFGLIRFGSRVDVYLPPGFSPRVLAGQISIAGESIIADSGKQE
ncbi:MAG: phosphatidylserine decarboxylase [Rhodospirillaceae bacterium]|nr:phosphatidylserine decarboxylase [Rhodospirillaceae bacterium]MBT5375149.1 phosphatidylserine decarboxylase [Rhodospirillaceae bacterium]MBT5658633.1 phosphatidylserine decarboxylase [Rhodospirillaceae bacterium]